MSKRQYPRLAGYRRPNTHHKKRQCAVCQKAPSGLQEVEVNWFRGDDLSVPCCGDDACKQEILRGRGWPA